MVKLTDEEIQRAVRLALEEDIGSGDVTTLATVRESATMEARMVAREPLVLAGIAFAEAAFRERDTSARLERIKQDGAEVQAGQVLLQVTGLTQALLTAERVALNFVQRLSGIASLTAQFVKVIAGTPAKILDTRKTTPGWRRFEKYAVGCGGGSNHRFGLFDLVLIKDNHLVAMERIQTNAIAAAVKQARTRYPNLQVEVEADTLNQVKQALAAGADIILLDNMGTLEMREAVKIVAGRSKLEASGGVCLETIRSIAETGVDFISVGALTHSAPAVDMALDFMIKPGSS